jgi:hypothetical protein
VIGGCRRCVAPERSPAYYAGRRQLLRIKADDLFALHVALDLQHVMGIVVDNDVGTPVELRQTCLAPLPILQTDHFAQLQTE